MRSPPLTAAADLPPLAAAMRQGASPPPDAGLAWCCHGVPVFDSPAEALEFSRGAALVAKLAVGVAAAGIGVLLYLGVGLY